MVVNSTDLNEALAWLDYCLGEVEAAGREVKKIAGAPENYHGFIEELANIITFRGGCARWRAGGGFALFPRSAGGRELQGRDEAARAED